MPNNNFISFIIPVFRNAGSLEATFEDIRGILNDKYAFEVIFVNDGSDDDSEQELLQLQQANREVQVIQFSRNFGQVPAIIAGLRAAKGQCSIVISADRQDPMEKVLEMLQLWENGYEVVIATREERSDGFFANMTSKIFYALMHKINPAMPKGGFDFFLLDEKPRTAYNAIEESNRFLQGDILWLGFKRIFIPYERKQRQIGRSQWSFRKKLKYLIDGFLTTSYVPIRLMSYIGMGVSLLGFAYALYIVFHWWTNKTPFDGWAPIMIVLLLTSGLLMIMLGIIGEYLWRAYDESRKRGQYIIKSYKKEN